MGSTGPRERKNHLQRRLGEGCWLHQWARSPVAVVAAGPEGIGGGWLHLVLCSWESHQAVSAVQDALKNGTSQDNMLSDSKAFLSSRLGKGFKVNGKEAWARGSRKRLTILR